MSTTEKNSITGSQEDNAEKDIRTIILLMFDICLVGYICVQYYTEVIEECVLLELKRAERFRNIQNCQKKKKKSKYSGKFPDIYQDFYTLLPSCANIIVTF